MSNIEDDIEILESIVKVHNDFLQGVNKESINEKEIRALEHLLSDYKNMKFNYENLIHDISLIAESLDMQEDSTIEEIALRISEEMYNQQQINEEHQKLNGELRQAINTVEKEKSDWIKAYQEEKDSQFELLKRIKELEEERNHWHGCFIVAMENSIAKEKVINVIQEHKDKIKRYKEYRIQGKETDVEYYENIANTIIVQVLQELLREDK